MLICNEKKVDFKTVNGQGFNPFPASVPIWHRLAKVLI